MVAFTPETLPRHPPAVIGPESDTIYFSSRLFKKDKDYRSAVLEATRLSSHLGANYSDEVVDLVTEGRRVCIL
jgi:hypothetical protein